MEWQSRLSLFVSSGANGHFEEVPWPKGGNRQHVTKWSGLTSRRSDGLERGQLPPLHVRVPDILERHERRDFRRAGRRRGLRR